MQPGWLVWPEPVSQLKLKLAVAGGWPKLFISYHSALIVAVNEKPAATFILSGISSEEANETLPVD